MSESAESEDLWDLLERSHREDVEQRQRHELAIQRQVRDARPFDVVLEEAAKTTPPPILLWGRKQAPGLFHVMAVWGSSYSFHAWQDFDRRVSERLGKWPSRVRVHVIPQTHDWRDDKKQNAAPA